MAEEKISIIELDVKQDDVTKKLADLSQKIKEQKDGIKELTTANKELSENNKESTDAFKNNAAQIETNKANVKGLSSEYSNNQKVLVNMTSSGDAQLGTLQKLAVQNKSLRKEQQGLNLTTEEGIKRNKEINVQVNANTKFTKEHSDALVQDKLNVGNYGSALDGLPGPMGRFVTGIKSMTKAALAFIATPIGAVIAAITLALGALTAGFKNSQKLMDIFSATMDGISAVISVVLDRFSNMAEFLGSIFNKELRESRKETKALNDELIGIEETMTNREKRQARRDAKPGLAEEIAKEFKQAQQLRKDLNALDDAEIAYMKTKAELKKVINESLLASKEEGVSEKERIELLDKALKAQKDLTAQEISFAKERARISQEQTDMGNSNRAEMKANEELQVKSIELEAQGANLLKKITSQRTGAIRKITKEDEKALLEKEKNYEKELQLWRDFDDQLAKEKDAAFQKSLDIDIANLDKEIAAQILGEEKATAYELNRKLFNIESQQALEDQQNNDTFDVRLNQLKREQDAEVAFAESIGADVNAIDARYALMQIDLEKEVQNAKLGVLSNAFGNIAQLFGENTGIAKAAAVAQATVNTYLGATAAFAQTPGGIIVKSLAAAAAVASGLKSVQKILSVDSGLPGDSGGGSAPTSGGIAATPAQLSFTGNEVLASRNIDTQNQSLETAVFNAMAKAPMQPVLVTDQVTVKQGSQKSVNEAAIV